MNAPNYLSLLRQNKQGEMPLGGTAQTAKSHLHGLCSSTLARIDPVIPGTATPCVVASRGWLLHYPDREPVEVYFSPVVTHAEVLRDFPVAVAAEPIPERTR